MKGDLLKKITNKINVDLAILQDKRLRYEFAKKMYFDVKTTGNNSIRVRALIGLLKLPGTLVSASGVSSSQKKIFFKYNILII